MKVQAVRRKVYSRKHDFGNAFLPKSLDFRKAVLYLSTPNSSSYIGDNTVRTKLITTVLNLYKGAASVQRFRKKKIFIFSLFFNRGQILFDSPVIFQHCFPIRNNELYNFPFSAVSNQDIDSLILFQLLLLSFHIATCRNDEGIRIPLLCLMNHLPRLPIRNVRYGAGID